MKKTTVIFVLALCVLLTFLVPIIQLSIGFQFIVRDGEDPNIECRIAPDLPLILAIGGIFALFFLGSAYGFLKMISSIGKADSDVAGHMPKILIGSVSLIFGSITLIFFILLQMRVYQSYSDDVQTETSSATNFCRSAIIHGSLAVIILNYLSILLFIFIVVIILFDTKRKIQHEKLHEIEMMATNH